VIGRLGWLAAGVVLGVTGYRRASRLARSVRPAGIVARWSWPASGPGAPAARFSRPAGRDPEAGQRGLGPFARDVRDGMELYLDRHSGPPGHNLEGRNIEGRNPERQQVAPRLAGYAGRSGGYPDPDNAKDGR
jgi:hypothetical protein